MENRVGFGPRLGAWALDVVVLLVLGFLLKGVVASLFPGPLAAFLEQQLSELPPQAAGARGMVEATNKFAFAVTFVGLAYGLTEAFAGWSVGKLILSLRIVDESGQKGPIGKLLIRYAIKQSGNIMMLVGFFAATKLLQTAGQLVGVGILIGCFFVLGRARQAIHDKIAGTAVLRKSDVGVTAASAPTPAASM